MPAINVVRSIQIDTPPQEVYDLISDYSTWTSWSPWLCTEPDADVTVSDDSNSVGSTYRWKGELVGQGMIEHRELIPGKLVNDDLEFLKPFKSSAKTKFELSPVAGGTILTWHMSSSLPWFMFFLKSMMEGMIAMDYDRGLKMIKDRLETGTVASTTKIRGIESVGPLHVIGVRRECLLKEIGSSMSEAFGEVQKKFAEHKLPTDGEMISIYNSMNIKTQSFDYTSGFAVPEGTSIPAGLTSWSLPLTKALAVEHVGAYHHLGNAWSAANQYARYKKLKQAKCGAFEIYRNSPHAVPEAELQTDIYLPLK